MIVVEDEEDVGQREKTKGEWSRLEKLVGAGPRLQQVAQDLVEHYETRSQSMDGKAMIVAMSRDICAHLYNEIVKIRPDWHDPDPEKGAIKIVMTGSASDKALLQPHIYNKKTKKRLEKRFKDINDPLKLVIVRDMWLTGFDAPVIHTMYVDKIMKGHNLMQAIARVNRVFEDKPSGLVVDFIGISGYLAEATKKYTSGGGKGKPAVDIELAVNLCFEQLETVKELMGDFTMEEIDQMDDREKLRWSKKVINDLLQTDPITDNFLREERKLSELVSMTSSDKRIWEIQDDVAIIQKIRKTIRKIKFPPGPQREKNERIKDLISKSLESQEIVDLAKMYDLDIIDISTEI